MAARTEAEILQSFKDSVKLSDETADTEKGPLFSLIGRPLSQVLAPVETEVSRLEQIYSSEFAKIANADEAQAFLTNWGEAAGTGTPATVRVFFMTFARPQAGQTIDVPIGSLVGNFDQTLQFITTEAGSIQGDFADTFFNAQRRTYEIGILCQAVANGDQYNLPSGRIINKVSNIPGIDAVENREDVTPGELAETTIQAIERVQQKFQGLAINTGNGSFTRIKRFAPTAILDVKTILPSDRKLFKRIVYTPAKDYYILGLVPKTNVQTFRARGGETRIPLSFVPAISINSVSVNKVPIQNFTLSFDSSVEFGGSAKAMDQCVLGFPLQANDVVSISVTYNSIIQDVQQQVLVQEQLFNTDELARQFNKVPLRIVMTGRALASYDPIVVQNNVLSEINALIPQGLWKESFFPKDFTDAVQQNVTGLTNLQLSTFQRSTRATSQLEIVLMDENEIATFDSNFVSVQIRNV